MEILLVEDDTDTQANLRDILQLDGHQVRVAGTAQRASELLLKHQVDVVILDRKLPDGTFDELLPRFMKIRPSVEVIVVTGFADLDSSIVALRHGAADYLLKPINPDALRKSIERIDIQRRTKHQLHQQQQFADRIVTTAEAVILVLDLSGRVVRFNPYFERITDWTLDELIGADWFEHCVPREDHEWLRDLFLQVASKIETADIVNEVLTKSGRTRQIRWSNTTLHNEADETTAVLAVGIDVTEFLAAQERAIRSHRLATIGQTMAALAHESRNSLQRIQAGVELLGLEIGDNKDAQNDLGMIQRAAKDLIDVLEEVRSYAGPIQLDTDEIIIAEVWRRAWRNSVVLQGDRELELVEKGDANSIRICGDGQRLEQVFRNLFENSFAASKDPVRVEVDCHLTDTNEVEVILSDNGPGLTTEQAERIFEAFFTTKRTGTGLGMAIVQRIIESHNGTISVDTCVPPQTGARFVIRLPRSEQTRS